MTAAAGTVVSCTVFLPAVNANQALQVPQTLMTSSTRASSLLLAGLLCCLPAPLKHTLSSTVHPVCQSHLVSSMQRVQHNWYCRLHFWLIAFAACSISSLLVPDCRTPEMQPVHRTYRVPTAPYSCFPGHPAQCSA
jgi:hypothetical protein